MRQPRKSSTPVEFVAPRPLRPRWAKPPTRSAIRQRDGWSEFGPLRNGPGLVSVILAVTTVLAGFTGPITSAAAQVCDDLNDRFGVADAQGLIDEINRVEAETGANVVVYATDVLQTDTLENDIRAICPASFGPEAADGADGTIIVGVSVGDRLSLVNYGLDYADSITAGEAETIREGMGDFFRDDDYSGGLASAVSALGEEIVDGAAGQSGGDAPLAGPEDAEGSGSGSTNSGSGSSGLSGGLIGGIAGVGGVGALGLGGAYLVSQRKKREAARTAARSRYENLDRRVSEVQSRWFDAEAEAELFSTRYAGSSVERLNTVRATATTASDQLSETWRPMETMNAGAIDEYTDAELEELGATLTTIDPVLAHAEEATGALATTTAEIGTTDDGLAQRIATLHESIATARATCDERASAGWTVDAARTRLTELEGQITAIDLDARPLDVDATHETMTTIEADTAEVNEFVATLEDQLREADERRHQARVEYDTHRSRHGQLVERIQRWRTEHAAASFERLIDYPDQVAAELAAAEPRLAQIESVGTLPRDAGPIRSVVRELDVIEEAMEDADDLLDEADDLDVTLASVKVEAPKLVAEAQEALNELGQYRSLHRQDLAASAGSSGEVERQLELATRALQERPPNFAFAAGYARDAAAAADAALAQAAAEVDRRNQVRRAAQSSVRDAELAIQRADRHVTSHVFSGRWDRQASQQLDSLRSSLRRIAQSIGDDPDRAYRDAEAIEDSAEEIYNEARRRQRQRQYQGGGGGLVIGGGGFGGGGYRGRSRSGGGFGMGSSSSSRRSPSRSSRSSSPRRSSGGGSRGGRGSSGSW